MAVLWAVAGAATALANAASWRVPDDRVVTDLRPIMLSLLEDLGLEVAELRRAQSEELPREAHAIYGALLKTYRAGIRVGQADTAAELRAVVQKVSSLASDQPHLRGSA